MRSHFSFFVISPLCIHCLFIPHTTFLEEESEEEAPPAKKTPAKATPAKAAPAKAAEESDDEEDDDEDGKWKTQL